ncbi:hypothetical protein DEU37_1367 [Microbacterium sp. AG790]|uniref:glycoside hydrolase family 43 protein n=1 Tax=Microbacterium sp. AG790 TaxID=2183995 RepID=UPI000F17C6E8|nr:glycoside hydrolase family 43 protein [Microbacterium sp. AG790]RKS90048.1 hypothetical protein DEU37_1367 [Microbacterium sp. AG790]
MTFDRYLFAYFRNGTDVDAEQIRFAISDDATARRWTVLRAGQPFLRSSVGEGGVRDPYLIRDPRGGRFFLVATDLHAAIDDDWARAVRHGSRSIVVWSSDDLVTWSAPWLAPVAVAGAGNAWAPKAYWDASAQLWHVVFASSVYDEGDDREIATHQRLFVTDTVDFEAFSPARLYLDRGHDVIDVALLEMNGITHRFSADSWLDDDGVASCYVSQERGNGIFDPDFTLVSRELGRPTLSRAEGPAPVVAVDGSGAFLLLDEFEQRGCQLFHCTDPARDVWRHVPEAALPAGARHGSLLPISDAEAHRLLDADGAA